MSGQQYQIRGARNTFIWANLVLPCTWVTVERERGISSFVRLRTSFHFLDRSRSVEKIY